MKRLLSMGYCALGPVRGGVLIFLRTHQGLKHQGPGCVDVYFAVAVDGKQVFQAGLTFFTKIESIINAANELEFGQRGHCIVLAIIRCFQTLIVIGFRPELTFGLHETLLERARAVITKPYEAHQVLQLVREVLDQ